MCCLDKFDSSHVPGNQWRSLAAKPQLLAKVGNGGINPATMFSTFFHMARIAGLCLLCAIAISCQRSATSYDSMQTGEDKWHDFEGTWTAAGSRSSLHLGGGRFTSVSTFTGSLMLSGASRPAVGFRSEVVVFNDSVTGMIGRAVWTDQHGDQAFSELRGEAISKNTKIIGKFIGGTGKYSGAIGTYEFAWRFLIENDDGIVQGQSVGLRGRVGLGSNRTESGS